MSRQTWSGNNHATGVSAMPRSTLEGWVPEVGGLVWLQLWNPTGPTMDATIEERIATGVAYGPRRLMRVYAVSQCPGGCGHPLEVLHFHLRDPRRPTLSLFPTDGREGPSWCESNWAVLEDASEDEGRLF